MKTNDKLKMLEKQITAIKEELLAVGPMRPGSLSRQFNVCGNPKCRCKDPENPKKHGPYYQLSYVHRGKHTTQFIKEKQVALVQDHINNYRKFKKLTQNWLSLALKHANLSLTMMAE
jgi:hypothetical protein